MIEVYIKAARNILLSVRFEVKLVLLICLIFDKILSIEQKCELKYKVTQES